MITESGITHTKQLVDQVQKAITGGAQLVQYRDKTLPATLRKKQAKALLVLCRNAGIPLLINDDVALAQAVGADGVHLGQKDVMPSAARAVLGKKALIGVSCYNSLEQARHAKEVDYVAFGSFFASSTKPKVAHAPIELLPEARRLLAIPIVAIGGITVDNGARLVEAGANMLAVVQGVFGAADPCAAAKCYQQIFRQ